MRGKYLSIKNPFEAILEEPVVDTGDLEYTQLLNQTSFEFPTSILTLPPAQNIPAPPTLPLDGGP
jgi:hypothetical protein